MRASLHQCGETVPTLFRPGDGGGALFCSRPPPMRGLRNVRHGRMVSVCSGPAVAALPWCIPRLLRVGSSRFEEPVSDSSDHVADPTFSGVDRSSARISMPVYRRRTRPAPAPGFLVYPSPTALAPCRSEPRHRGSLAARVSCSRGPRQHCTCRRQRLSVGRIDPPWPTPHCRQSPCWP